MLNAFLTPYPFIFDSRLRAYLNAISSTLAERHLLLLFCFTYLYVLYIFYLFLYSFYPLLIINLLFFLIILVFLDILLFCVLVHFGFGLISVGISMFVGIFMCVILVVVVEWGGVVQSVGVIRWGVGG